MICCNRYPSERGRTDVTLYKLRFTVYQSKNFSNFLHTEVELFSKICYNVYVYTKNTKGMYNDKI